MGILLGGLANPVPPAAHGADPFLRRTAAVEAVSRVGPSVVNITTERVMAARQPFRSPFEGDPLFERFFRDFFEPRVSRRVQSLGSGVIIDAARHVLTNEHVVARASRIRVALADGRKYDAELVGADPNNDLAVLRVQSEESLPWTAPGSSADLMVGEPVIAIGNPFGLSSTVTTGVISALDRSIRSDDRVFHGFLQTDASINPGNSGGPLLDATGRLIGINTAIYAHGQGIGFAIPIDTARRVVEQLIAHGQVAPVWLGLELQSLDASLEDVLELPAGLRGALVAGVAPDTPAARAGVRRGDLVVGLDGHPIRTPRELYEILERATTGQEMALELWREGARRTLRVRALEIPPAEVLRLGERLLGLGLAGHPHGGFQVTKVRPGSGAERIGLRAGDRLLGINGRAVAGEETLRSSVLELRGRSRALLVVQRGPARYHVQVPLS